MNVNWGETIRTSLLFLFFGICGATSIEAKILLLAMAPLSFVCQLRFVKLAGRSFFYTSGVVRPDNFFATLLPATTQTILEWNEGSREWAIEAGDGFKVKRRIVEDEDGGEDEDYFTLQTERNDSEKSDTESQM